MFVVYLLSDFLTSGSSDNYQNSVVAGGEGRAGGGTGTWIPHNCPTGQLSPYCMCCFSINVEIQ